MNLTWEQKVQALNALAECELCMRAPGDWYTHQSGISLTNGHILTSGNGNGATPEAAVEAQWTRLVTDIPDNSAIAVRKGGIERHVRWNGFMWVDVEKPT